MHRHWFTPQRMALTALTAAVYAALTVLLPIPAYGQIQCRLSEVMVLLAFINPVFVPGLLLGCFIANLFSSVNPLIDCVVGTFASAVALLGIVRLSGKNLIVASLWPTVSNGVFIGGMILFTAGVPWTLVNFLIPASTVALGEFLAVTVAGCALFGQLLRNKRLVEFLRNF